ncbi:hypothetical protein ACJIZ3_020295 [Penstemon smallii]|uniref:Ribosomal protein L1 n=1 Tax=Penstemon smallii TaxID=265156 RepID=A0ABD3SIQ0_9LAMI
MADRISEEAVRKAVNALLKWKTKLQPQSHHQYEEDGEAKAEAEAEAESDDSIYLSLTLKKAPPQQLTLTPHRIPLRHSLLPKTHSQLNFCLIVDGKKIKSEAAHKILKNQNFPFTLKVMKLSKIKSDYKSFETKKKLHDSFDLFFAAKGVVPFLPMVLGKVFYSKKRKVPVTVDLKADGSNWKEEIERASNSSLLFLSSGTCSAVRVGKWGVTEGQEIVENVFEAIDGVLDIPIPKKWGGVRCFHLKFSDSLALPIYEHQPTALLVGEKRKRTV